MDENGVERRVPIRNRNKFTAPGFIREMLGNNIFQFKVKIPSRVQMPLCGIEDHSGTDLWDHYARSDSFYGLAQSGLQS